MIRSVLYTICLIIWCTTSDVQTQETVSESTAAVSNGLSAFTMELLAKTAAEGGKDMNIIVSTYSIWNLLAILNEGARGSTSNQLQGVLRIPSNNNVFKVGYKAIASSLTNTPGVEINIANAIFSDMNKQLSKDFRYQTSMQYKVNFVPVNFADIARTANYIDSFIANATDNRLKHFINYEDLTNAQLLLTTAIFFKGQWKLPFNSTATKRSLFYDENMNPLGYVDLMYQIGPYPYVMLENLEAHAVELTYGDDERYSMIVLLPMPGVALSRLLTRLTTVPFQTIYDALEQAKENFFGEDAEVWLPRFKISSDYVLNIVLEQMGILDVFDPYYADLRKMSSDNFYLSRVIHKAEIEVTEEGTIAVGASGGVINYKQQIPQFNATRPFAYFIVEKTTKTILFAGKVSNPNELK